MTFLVSLEVNRPLLPPAGSRKSLHIPPVQHPAAPGQVQDINTQYTTGSTVTKRIKMYLFTLNELIYTYIYIVYI